MSKKPGYHLKEIPKGEFGEFSKVLEENFEYEDAMNQGCFLMALLELSDLYGAVVELERVGKISEDELNDMVIEIEKKVKAIKKIDIYDIKRMNYITQRAFKNGHRS